MLMIVPITLITAVAIVCVALSALQAMTEEEFAHGAVIPRRGVHAEQTGSLKQASIAAIRRAPRPAPPRQRPDDLLKPVAGS